MQSNHEVEALPSELAPLLNKKILVTGAAGFIGGALFRRLHQYGIDVVGTVLYQKEADALNREGFKAYVLDLASDDSWDALLQDVDIVFNIAAMFQEVEHGRAMFEKVNNFGAVKLLQTAHRNGVELFVHCSTVGVHGSVKEIPATEDTPFNPMDLYHETKLEGELAILDYAKSIPADGMVVTVNRPAMVYGPGDDRMLKLFSTILAGKFFMVGSGNVLAHLGYIDDQVDSFLYQAVAPRENIHLEEFNIASGVPVTLNDLTARIAEVGGVSLPKIKVPVWPIWLLGLLCEIVWKPFNAKPPLFRRRVGFFTHNRAFDLSKSQRLINYQSKVDMIDGVKLTVDWYKDNQWIK